MITLLKAEQISLAKISSLRPGTQTKVREWYDACHRQGLRVYVYEGFRTCQRQDELFAKGATVTRARGGQSMHQYRLAIDFVCLSENRKAEGFFEAAWNDEKRYAVCHAIAAKHGLRRLSWETPHLEDADFRDWRDARERFGDPCRG